jgi:hypothetical protein
MAYEVELKQKGDEESQVFLFDARPAISEGARLFFLAGDEGILVLPSNSIERITIRQKTSVEKSGL